MPRIACIAILTLLLGVATTAPAIDRVVVSTTEQARIWDSAVRENTARLLGSTRADSDGQTVLAELQALQDDREIDAVRKDAILFAYVDSLRSGDVATIPDRVLGWLSLRESVAYVRHDESVTAVVPLFDVAAAARGLANQKRYEQTRRDWLSAAPERYDALVRAYAQTADSAARNGAEAAMVALAADRKSYLISLIESSEAVAVEGLLVALYLAKRDLSALQDRVRRSMPITATRILRFANELTEPVQILRLCTAGLAHSDPGIRGLAIACGTRASMDDSVLRADWFGELMRMLADPVHGSAAALQIARLTDDDTFDKLTSKQAGDTDPLLAKRLELIRRLRAISSTKPESSP